MFQAVFTGNFIVATEDAMSVAESPAVRDSSRCVSFAWGCSGVNQFMK